MSLPAYALPEAELIRQCRIDTFRSHGPGGQHANRTESAVRITHLASGEVSQCQDHRERARNQHDALRRLRLRLAVRLRGKADPAWLDAYRRARQLAIGAHAEGYILAVAVALDALERASGSLAAAGDELKISASQIAKLLRSDKEVLGAALQLRALHGLGAIR
jgi:protein subunit release factor B